MAELPGVPKEGLRYRFDAPAGGSPLDAVRHHFQGLYPTPRIHGEHVLEGAFQVVVEGEGGQRQNRLVHVW